MGFLSRLFGRVQEAPVAPPERTPGRVEPIPAPPSDPKPVAAEPEPEPELEPEPDVEPGSEEPELDPEPAPAPEPVAAEAEPAVVEPDGPPAELSLTLDEAIAALRAAGSDGIRIGFLARDYARAAEEDRGAARKRLVGVLTDQLRARGLLASEGRFELREESLLAVSPPS